MINLKNSYSKVCGVCYDEIDIFNIVEFCNNHNYKYYYIKHYGDDENFKEHYHFIISSDSKHRFNVSTILRKENENYIFGPNLIQPLKSINSYLRYMVHIDYDDKIKYQSTDILSNDSQLNIDYYIFHYMNSKENKEANFNLILTLVLDGELQNLKSVIEFCLSNNIAFQPSWTYTLKNLF